MASGLAFNRKIISIIFAVATVALVIASFAFGYNASAGLLASDVNIYYFFVGMMLFHWRDHIPYRVWLLIPCVVLSYFLMMIPQGVYVVPALLTYTTVVHRADQVSEKQHSAIR